MHLALANLAVKAWAAHVAGCERRHISTISQPSIILTFLELTQQINLYSPSASTRAAASSSQDQDQRSTPAMAAVTMDASYVSHGPQLLEGVLQSSNQLDYNAHLVSSGGLYPEENSPLTGLRGMLHFRSISSSQTALVIFETIPTYMIYWFLSF